METTQKEYSYPPYVPDMQLMKGLYYYEWFMVAGPTILGTIIFKILGTVIGLIMSFGIWTIFVRSDGRRTNIYMDIMSSLRYFTSQRIFIKRERSNLELDEEQSEHIKNNSKKSSNSKKPKKGKKKKVSKKDKKKKEKNMQDLFPFKSIEDSKIEMENGDLFLFLKIRSNNLDLLSIEEINKMIEKYSKDIDRDKFNVSYFIQDSVFKIQKNIDAIDTAKKKQKIPFLASLLEQGKNLLLTKKDTATKKFYAIRIHINSESVPHIRTKEIIGRIKAIYKETLNPLECPKIELKQMLAIYGNRVFADDIADSELLLNDEDTDTSELLVKKKVTYQNQQLPGIYEFKDLIVPITTEFLPSSCTIGQNILKNYAIASFVAKTKDTNILADIANIDGVTTSIYIEKLSLKKYKNNMRLDLKSKRTDLKDDVDVVDYETDRDSMVDSYRISREQNKNMYYISVYFQISARTHEDFKKLEDTFLDAIDDMNLTLDPLKTKQKEAYQSISPIGTNKLGDLVKQNISSESVANLYPFDEPTLLDPTGLYIGDIVDKEMPLLFDPFTYRGTNRNILILGLSGIGKTVLMMLLLQNAASMGAYIRNIDFEGTQVKFIEKLGGINIDISGQTGDFVINPLQIRIPDEITRGVVEDYISEVKSLFRIYRPQWTDDMLDVFEDYLQRTYENKGINNNIDLRKLKNTDYPIVSDVYELIEKDYKNFENIETYFSKEDMRKVLTGLKNVVKGSDSKMLNRHTYFGLAKESGNSDEDIFHTLQIVNFDFSNMMGTDMPRKLAQWTNVFTYISQFVNSNMDQTKQIILSIDELHEILKKEYISIVDIISSYERRFRKYLACFLKSTQTLDEVNSKDTELESKVKPLFSQSAIKFLFHLGDADYTVPKDLMNLSNSEIEKMKENRSHQCIARINSALYDLDVFMPEWFKSVKADAE